MTKEAVALVEARLKVETTASGKAAS
jgi:hypothetical protein